MRGGGRGGEGTGGGSKVNPDVRMSVFVLVWISINISWCCSMCIFRCDASLQLGVPAHGCQGLSDETNIERAATLYGHTLSGDCVHRVHTSKSEDPLSRSKYSVFLSSTLLQP